MSGAGRRSRLDALDDDELGIVDAAPAIRVSAAAERPTFAELVGSLGAERHELSVAVVPHDALTNEALAAAELILIECRVLESFEDLARIRALRQARPLVPILVLCANADPEFGRLVFQAGATDLIAEDARADTLAAKLVALHALARGVGLMELQNQELVSSMQSLRLEMVERQKAEEARNLAQEQAQESAKLASLGEMAGGIAHEVKTPLAVITGGASMLRDMCAQPAPPTADILEALVDMEKMADRINNIIRGLKSFSRQAESDPYEMTPIAHVLRDTLPLCDDVIERADIVLDVRSPPPELAVACQPTQISQIVLNLLGNAKHAVEGHDERWIRVETRDLGDHVELSITDSGPGIPVELQDKIFLPFFTTKAKGVGTGLGLSISTKIAVAHGGRLYLDKTAANTRFVLRLPKVSAPA